MKRITPIIPTIFSHNKREFMRRLEKVGKVAHHLQIDFMDGKFVPGKSVALKDIPMLQGFNNSFEAHLMVEQPGQWVEKLSEKGFSRVIFHYEALASNAAITKLITKIRQLHMTPELAINPETPIEELFPFLNEVPVILVMGITPGKEKQPFRKENFQRIRRLRERCKNITIQVDGGISNQTIQKLASVGVDYFNSGSYIALAKDPFKAIQTLVALAHKGLLARKNAKKISQPYDKITPQIFIGPNRCCVMPGFDKVLLEQGITADISLEEFRVDTPIGVTSFLWLPTPDHYPPSKKQLFTGVVFLDAMVKQRVKTYVHCELGHTRAPTLVIAYLMTQGKTFDDAFTFVKKKRPSIGISKEQRKGLLAFERAWEKQKS